MDARLRNRLDMLHRTLAHFDGAPGAWGAHEPVVRNVGTLRDGAAEMDRAARAQAGGATGGLTEAKRAARAHAAGLLHALGQKAAAYALEAGDADLRRAVDHSRSDWLRLPDEAFGPEADAALDRVEAALPALAPYGVAAGDVAAARAAVEEAHTRNLRRDATAAGRAVATDDLEEAYSAVVPTLEVLDRLVPALVGDAAFVATYAEVRRIEGD